MTSTESEIQGLLARVGVVFRGLDRGRVRSVGGRNPRCLSVAVANGASLSVTWSRCLVGGWRSLALGISVGVG
jgi:hypothetical protein